MMKWKIKLIMNNMMTHKASHVVNVLSLSLAVIVFSLFAGFFISQQDLLYHTSTLFPEYLVANIEKSEEIESDSSFLKLKQISRPSESEISSFLLTGINAEVRHNYADIFAANEYYVYGKKIFPMTPIFLFDFTFSEEERSLLVDESQVKPTNQSVYVNEAMLERLATTVHYEDYTGLNIESSLKIHHLEETLDIPLSYQIAGVFKELDYLSSPKIYFSQQGVDTLFKTIKFNDDVSLFDYIASLPPTDPLTSYSFRLYFETMRDLERALMISDSLKTNRAYLNVTSEHLVRLDSLSELMSFSTIIISISVILIIFSLLFINITITHLELKRANAKIALLYFFKASTNDILDIYLGQNLVTVLVAMSALFVVPFLAKSLNQLLSKVLGMSIEINIPLLVYQGIPLFIPLLIFAFVFISASVISVINILIKNQKALVKRLAHND